MDQDKSMDVDQSNIIDTETEKNVIPQKYINKVVQNFMKCISTLVQHVENAVSYSNGKIIANSSTISNEGIEIEEHSIKEEPDDTKKCLKHVKKSVLQLCLVCIDKNIFVECNIKFEDIDFYKWLDEYTRSLVLDYLSENIACIINHVSDINEMFRQQKGKQEAKTISKSLLKLYKQILFIPLNCNVDDTTAFQNENATLFYDEAKVNLADKLVSLRTSLIKLKKIFRKNISNPEPIIVEDTDTNESGKRKAEVDDTQVKKKKKLDEKHVELEKSASDGKKKRKESKEKNDKGNSSENEIITELLFNESDKDTKLKNSKEENSDSNKENQQNNSLKSPKKKNRTLSECSDIHMEKLYTSELSILDEDVSLSNSLDNEKDEMPSEVKQLSVEELINNLKSGRRSLLNPDIQEDNEIMHGIFSGMQRESVLAEINEEENKLYERIINDYSLNERYVLLQSMIKDMKAKRELAEKNQEKLATLEVKIDWEVHESHKIENRICGASVAEESKALAAFNISDKKFSTSEDEIIKRNWKRFCRVHGLQENPAPFTALRYGVKGILSKADRVKFAQFLARDLPNRSLHGVYRRFKNLFKNGEKTGRYTSEEDAIILTYCSHMPSVHRFNELAELLNRNRRSVEARYKILLKPLNNRIKWNMDLKTDIVRLLLKNIGSKNVQDLQTANLTIDHFKKVGKAMSIDYVKVHIHFYKYIYPLLFSPEILIAGNIRAKIVNILLQTGVTDWKKINWKEVTEHFPGLTAYFLMGQLTLALHQVVPKKLHNNLPEALKSMKKHIDERDAMGIHPFTDRIIRRYCFTEVGLQMVD